MRRGIVVIAGLLIVPALLLAQKVTIDSDPAARFAGYHTYAWAEGAPASNPLAESRIHAGVDRQLAAKHFSPSAGPDLFVATHVVSQPQQQIVTDGFGGGFLLGGLVTASVQTYVQGTLVVDLYDASTKQLVWRGTGTATVSDSPDKNTAKVNKALAKMFMQYPPRQKK